MPATTNSIRANAVVRLRGRDPVGEPACDQHADDGRCGERQRDVPRDVRDRHPGGQRRESVDHDDHQGGADGVGMV